MITNNNHVDNRNKVLRELKDAGVSTVRLSFSGGNDEGSVYETVFLDADSNPVAVSLPENRAYENTEYNQATKTWDKRWVVWDNFSSTFPRQSRPATPDEISHANDIDTLEAPIYDKFGSFAGDFYVDGVLVWDVVAGTYTLSGQETVQSYESFEYENE